jgi:hypothetical protein
MFVFSIFNRMFVKAVEVYLERMLSNYIFAYKLISFTRGPKESVIAHLVFNFTTISRPARLVIFFIVLIETTVSR